MASFHRLCGKHWRNFVLKSLICGGLTLKTIVNGTHKTCLVRSLCFRNAGGFSVIWGMDWKLTWQKYFSHREFFLRRISHSGAPSSVLWASVQSVSKYGCLYFIYSINPKWNSLQQIILVMHLTCTCLKQSVRAFKEALEIKKKKCYPIVKYTLALKICKVCPILYHY